jgi:hypothetical protein
VKCWYRGGKKESKMQVERFLKMENEERAIVMRFDFLGFDSCLCSLCTIATQIL